VELAFAKKSLRQLCESETKAIRDLGVKVAGLLKRRLADLRAATSVKDLVAGRPRGRESGREISIDLCQGVCIVLCANHNNIPKLETGDTDWSRVTRVKILRIEDTHD
jgi:toxin HigB-1